MFEKIGSEPIAHPSRADKKKARLTKQERNFYNQSIALHRCEVTGTPRSKKKPTEIHHLWKVEHGGRKSIDNLAALSKTVHDKVHSTAAFICQHDPSKNIAEVTEQLSKMILQDGKMDRVMKGEDPDIVYNREFFIEAAQSQMSFDDLEG